MIFWLATAVTMREHFYTNCKHRWENLYICMRSQKRNSFDCIFAKEKHIKCSSNHVHDSHKFNRVAKLKLVILISLCILLLFSVRELTFCKWLFAFLFPTDTKIYRWNICLIPNCTLPNSCYVISFLFFDYQAFHST